MGFVFSLIQYKNDQSRRSRWIDFDEGSRRLRGLAAPGSLSVLIGGKKQRYMHGSQDVNSEDDIDSEIDTRRMIHTSVVLHASYEQTNQNLPAGIKISCPTRSARFGTYQDVARLRSSRRPFLAIDLQVVVRFDLFPIHPRMIDVVSRAIFKLRLMIFAYVTF